eukprot:1143908-Pelagomonas_calceolata.AAC.1
MIIEWEHRRMLCLLALFPAPLVFVPAFLPACSLAVSVQSMVERHPQHMQRSHIFCSLAFFYPFTCSPLSACLSVCQLAVSVHGPPAYCFPACPPARLVALHLLTVVLHPCLPACLLFQSTVEKQRQRAERGRALRPLHCINTAWLGGVDWETIEAKALVREG